MLNTKKCRKHPICYFDKERIMPFDRGKKGNWQKEDVVAPDHQKIVRQEN